MGVERGWRRREGAPGSRAAGLRTFALAGLFGGLSGLAGRTAGPIPMAALMLAFAATFLFYEAKESEADRDLSATSAVAGLVTALLGALTFYAPPMVIAAAAVAHVALLAFRESLHTWLTKLTWPEIRGAVALLAMTFIVSPLLPDKAVDPWGAFVPRQLWWMTVLIGAASFAGYVALRALPAAAGLMASALAGSIVSSTAVTLDLARRTAADGAAPRLAVAAAFAATAVMAVRVMIIAAVVAPGTVAKAWPGLAAAAAVSALLAAAAQFRAARDTAAKPPKLGSPLDLKTVLRFGLALAVLTAAGRLISAYWGPAAFLPFSAAAGFADVDAAVLAITQAAARVDPALAATGILIAAGSNLVLKSIIAFAAGKLRFGLPYLAGSAAAAAAGGAAAFGARWLGY